MDLEAQLSFDEDDVFYSDLRRRILILTSDDDDDEQQGTVLSKPRTDVVDGGGGGGGGGGFGYWRHDQYQCVVNPVLFVEMGVGRFKSAGTGVFIPQIRTSTAAAAAAAQSAPMRKHNSSTGGRMKCRSRPASQKRRTQQFVMERK
ncbi:hypothetical protein Sjap_024359 [Stephania japonica]|uniref:Uncharacterized protein n=1 Tax=Stephania japonica TaxID=461633 RepID=A0AAP0HNM6_9MAGN